MTETELRQLRELAGKIESEALRGAAAIAAGSAPTGSSSLVKISTLSRDLNRVLSGEVRELAAAGDRPTDDPRYQRGAH